MGAQPYPPHQSPHELASVSAAVNANAKATADLWRSREGQRFHMARGCFHMPEEMYLSLVSLLLKKVAGVSQGMVRQLQSLPGFGTTLQVAAPRMG